MFFLFLQNFWRFFLTVFQSLHLLKHSTRYCSAVYSTQKSSAFSEVDVEPDVDLTTGEIVGHGILDAVDVGYPIVVADVGYVEEVEEVESEPDALYVAEHAGACLPLFELGEESVGESYVNTFVWRGAEVAFVAAAVWRGHGESVGKDAFEAEFESRYLGEVVGEEDGEVVAAVSGAGHLDAVEVLLGFHQREAYPGIASGHELPEELEVEPHGMAFGEVLSGIGHLEVVEFVGYEVGEELVVYLTREFEGAPHGAEGVVGAGDKVDAALRFDVGVEAYDVVAVGIGDGQAVFLVEGCLVVESGGKAQRPVGVAVGHEAYVGARAEEGFAVEAPVGQTQSAVEHKESGCGAELYVVLQECGYACAADVLG